MTIEKVFSILLFQNGIMKNIVQMKPRPEFEPLPFRFRLIQNDQNLLLFQPCERADQLFNGWE